MPSHLHADHTAAQPPDPGRVDDLITQARRLRGQLDAVRRESAAAEGDPRGRWQRALCDLAVHQLDDLGHHLDQLREGLPPSEDPEPGTAYGAGPAGSRQALPGTARPPAPGRAGSAEWNLLTDEVTWSDELYEIFGRTPQDGPLTLDELPSWLFAEDQQTLTAMATGCLVDGRPIDGEFRIVRPDGSVRTVHMVGEPVLDVDGSTASLWAVLRDVSELRRSEQAVRETRDSLRLQQQAERAEQRLAAELQQAVLPPWRGAPHLLPGDGSPGLDLAAHYFTASGPRTGGGWYDALGLPCGATLLTVGDLTGHGVAAASSMAMLLGALRGLAIAGLEPGALLARLNQLLDQAAQPALAGALCCRYESEQRTLTWAQAGHPAPLLFRAGTGRALDAPEGMLLGVSSGARYGRHSERLERGDLLVLYTEGLVPRRAAADPSAGAARLLALAPRFGAAAGAQEGVRVLIEELGTPERQDDACVLVARVP